MIFESENNFMPAAFDRFVWIIDIDIYVCVCRYVHSFFYPTELKDG